MGESKTGGRATNLLTRTIVWQGCRGVEAELKLTKWRDGVGVKNDDITTNRRSVILMLQTTEERAGQ
jgi:hypothetical protein